MCLGSGLRAKTISAIAWLDEPPLTPPYTDSDRSGATDSAAPQFLKPSRRVLRCVKVEPEEDLFSGRPVLFTTLDLVDFDTPWHHYHGQSRSASPSATEGSRSTFGGDASQ